METRVCSKCNQEKPLSGEYYRPRKHQRGGLNTQCRMCEARYREATKERTAERQRAYYLANKERIAERERARYAKYKVQANERSRRNYQLKKDDRKKKHREYRVANKEHIATRSRTYREANKEREAERARARYVANKEKILKRTHANHIANRERRIETDRLWRLANKMAVRAKSHRRRALKLAAGGMHTAEDIKRLYEAQRRKCYYCKSKLGSTYHVDHVVPLSRGGSNGPENLVISCVKCNLSKGDRLPHEWVQGGRLL